MFRHSVHADAGTDVGAEVERLRVAAQAAGLPSSDVTLIAAGAEATLSDLIGGVGSSPVSEQRFRSNARSRASVTRSDYRLAPAEQTHFGRGFTRPSEGTDGTQASKQAR